MLTPRRGARPSQLCWTRGKPSQPSWGRSNGASMSILIPARFLITGVRARLQQEDLAWHRPDS